VVLHFFKKFFHKSKVKFIFLFFLVLSLVLGLRLSQTQQDIRSDAAGTSLSLTLFLHGVGKGGDNVNPVGNGNGNLRHVQRSIKVEVYDEQGKVVLIKEGGITFNNQNGNFTGTVPLETTLPSGSYTLRVKTTQHLRVKVPGIYTFENSITQLPPIYLISGDINNDNTLNILDYNLLIGCYEEVGPAVNCNPNNKVLSDLTDDGTVNGFDYNLFLREISTRRGEDDGPVIPPTATKTPTPTATRTPTPTPTRTPTPTPTRTPTPVPPVSSGTSKCPLPKYPSASCTGVPSGTSLTTVSGSYTAKAGEVVDKKKITGTLTVGGNNVVIKNSEIQRGINYTRNSFTVEDTTIGPPSGCLNNTEGVIGLSNFTMRRVWLRNISEGVRISGSNVVIQDSYFSHCEAQGVDDPHSDGIQAYGAGAATNIVIDHNTIDMRSVPSATAPIFIPTDRSDQGNTGITASVTNNVVAGGGYSLQMPGNLAMTLTKVTGNKVVNNTWGYNPIDVTCSRVGTWSGNAVVTFDFNTGTILSQVRALNDCN
jgi:hypothetical protein